MKLLARKLFRKAIYSTPLRSLVPENKKNVDPAYWDRQIAGPFAPYLGGTMSVDVRNSITANLVRHHAVPNPSVLDVACAGGTLANALDTFERYVGIDISKVAIGRAKQNIKRPNTEYLTCDLTLYELPQSFDVIVFNEVLMYPEFNVAISQVARYAAALRPNGIIIASMKDDPKSRALVGHLAPQYQWVDGVLNQACHTGPSYRIRPDAKRPAYLTFAMKPHVVGCENASPVS